jgi:hypothetical protein
MPSELVQAVETAKNTLARLTLQLQNSRKGLGVLYRKYGFSDNAEFIKELRGSAATPKSKRKGSSAKAGTKPTPTKKRGKRTRITPEIKAAVKAAVKEGKTGAAIAKSLKISVPSVHNIKKELGLVRSRS